MKKVKMIGSINNSEIPNLNDLIAIKELTSILTSLMQHPHKWTFKHNSALI
jgi:hypothetical protein